MAGIYIHIPFCRKACHYCNFHFSTQLKYLEETIDGIVKEIGMPNDFIDTGAPIDTIYFGGGTPSLLSKELLMNILYALRKKFKVSDHAELTIETNPDDITAESLMMWSEAGFNRLSVGMQSFNEEELQWMNRSHTAKQSIRCLEMIRDSAFRNYTVDLITGSPYCTEEQLKQSLEMLSALQVPHISSYALTVEPGTALHHFVQHQKSPDVQQEHQARQLLLTSETLTKLGYEHYEISNFAMPGFRSNHNSNYWNGSPYFGFGPSAHSYDGKRTRRWNVANNALYIKSISQNQLPFEEEILSPQQQYNEHIMIRLRTAEGISIKQVSASFGVKKAEALMNQLQPFIASKDVVEYEKECYRLSAQGRLLADGISASLFEE